MAAARPRPVTHGIRAGLSQYPPLVEELVPYAKRKGVPFESLWKWDGGLDVCQVMHPGQHCLPHAVRFFVTGLGRAAAIYLPVHAIYALMLVARSHKPAAVLAKIAWRFAQNVFWSCAFLSMYVTMAFKLGCFWLQWFNIRQPTALYATMWLPGLAVLLDHKSRRLELALYCLPKAIEIFWGWHMKRPLQHTHWLLFALAMAGMSHSYQRHSEVSIRPSVRVALKWLWGSNH